MRIYANFYKSMHFSYSFRKNFKKSLDFNNKKEYTINNY